MAHSCREQDSPIVTFKVYELKESEDDSPYVVDTPKKLDLIYCAPALKAGLKGMKLGEKRRIYIHSSSTHGVYSPFALSDPLYYDIEVVSLD